MKRTILVLFVSYMVLHITGCASGSYILTGERREAISPDAVQLYTTPPKEFEIIAIVKASSANGWTQQGSMNYAVDELKQQAAKLGANGLIIDGTGESTSSTVTTYGENVAYSSSSTAQIVSGKAIYVPPEQ